MEASYERLMSEPRAQKPEIQSSIELRNSGSASDSSGSSSNGGPSLDEFSVNNVLRQKRDSRDKDDSNNLPSKKRKTRVLIPGIHRGFSSLAVVDAMPVSMVRPEDVEGFDGEKAAPIRRCCRQFWKAGDYEGDSISDSAVCPVGIDHVRVHPKFLHSNATSHKWALGALAELVDNSFDEVCNGATYVHIDSTICQKDKKSNMLIVEDNGGGMDPDRIRQCMSLGYSAKSKMANTIGQYGNGFKTSTMRLGADVIVFSRCQGRDGKSPTQSIGMLSYTFLRGARKEDIVVPMIDFEKVGNGWKRIIRSTVDDWNTNLETILEWSPYLSEADLFKQFNFLGEQGTRIVIYNLWEDDQGLLELDFDADPYDIQLRGVNRDEKNIEMAEKYPNSRHFLTYRHSLRSYASILYLRLPPRFRIILRGKDVEHHNIVNDMMLAEEMIYKPLHTSEGTLNQNMVASVTLGFVKDAYHHIDIQGFNVYHKNRLIKPFWRVWNAAGSDGRGVIGVLEANFVEPAHDKQGFERTTVLSRLENRLIKYQKSYWASKCHEIGYAPKQLSKKLITSDRESTPPAKQKLVPHQDKKANGSACGTSKAKEGKKSERRSLIDEPTEDTSLNRNKESSTSAERIPCPESQGRNQKFRCPSVPDALKEDPVDSIAENLFRSKNGNHDQTKRLNETGSADLLSVLQREKERSKLLESELQEAKAKLEEMGKEHIALIDIFQEERGRRDVTEEGLRQKLREASDTIGDLVKRVKQLEARLLGSHNPGK